MFPTYRPTPLEEWVSQFYCRLSIFHPEDLDETEIARSLGIYLFYKEAPCMSYEFGRFKSITIDKRLKQKVQRERFYHELCHILRHAGRQIMMPEAFRELQERDAKHFTRYAALPLHMLKNFDPHDPYIIENLSERFNVTPELCVDRLQRIKKNIFEGVGLYI
ncbi:Zn-dependent peptidase ImmA (M78 family) [Brevibacillus aydinogluensis]|uniref:ImmA/IrrE family metallo-endopeptidase n=1 Tax=Brevibacillus aydinogluensis TaxID=927786 RepID=UPI0028932DA6|nr:ImmA/IrrE family metallo-endopeptidase [Brevibacillus aydinogluensis]MDT3416131.1 Zn-dependent peptidase ImmA (M78 family) [Brevibacillus aydinogluensis]